MTILAVADLFFFSFFFLGRAIEGARYNSDQTLQTCFLYQEQRVCITSIYYFAFINTLKCLDHAHIIAHGFITHMNYLFFFSKYII